MIVAVKPSNISGTIHAPASKSAMQRALAAALLSEDGGHIINPGNSNDDLAAIKIIESLGARIEKYEDGSLGIQSCYDGLKPVFKEIDCGESGLSLRMFAPIIATSNEEFILTGTGSLKNRPMNFIEEVLPKLGVEISSSQGQIPIVIKGPLKPRDIIIDGSITSQFLTGLLFAYWYTGEKDAIIKVAHLKSKPYIDLTIDVMKKFGMLVEHRNYEEFYFPVEKAIERQISYHVEGDWSGAAFLLTAAAITGRIKVEGLEIDSTQADKRIIDALSLVGASVSVTDEFIEVSKEELKPFEFDATDSPDLFPPLVALAANCNGISKILGLRRLKHKESNRGLALQEEFKKLNTRIDLNDDEMIIHGNEHIIVKDPQLESHNDHRIAMACAVASLNADAEVHISNADAVKKSYPDFWDHLKSLNADLSLKPFTTDNTFRL